MGKSNEEAISESVGLWLAEGGTTLKNEITFTNNCLELIDLFYKTINHLFKNETFKKMFVIIALALLGFAIYTFISFFK